MQTYCLSTSWKLNMGPNRVAGRLWRMTFQIIQFGFLKSIVVFNRVCIPDAPCMVQFPTFGSIFGINAWFASGYSMYIVTQDILYMNTMVTPNGTWLWSHHTGVSTQLLTNRWMCHVSCWECHSRHIVATLQQTTSWNTPGFSIDCKPSGELLRACRLRKTPSDSEGEISIATLESPSCWLNKTPIHCAS